MKNSLIRKLSGLIATAGAVLLLTAVPSGALAKDKDKKKDKDKDRDKDHRSERYRDHDHDKDHDRYVYRGRKRHYETSYYRRVPRSSFSIIFGNGFRGPGYYYGPSDADYFYDAPGVTYYRSISSIPGRSYSSDYGNLESQVQVILARRGYYRGPVDGDFGPMSRQALAGFQRDTGLRPTGSIDRSTISALGL